ncbi:hypothetical protein RJ639_018374 [Escallonia herrerae]|uniref:Uncharacterized protein n=1 Tax=Escallonia herrerae TaxID=1293975 RepID=A0AA89AIT1_9ASTE|nr:hypothetical protein RJ639_018374 [Escallonia herrerae]
MDPSIYGDDLMFQSLRDKYNEMRPENFSEAESLVHSSVAIPIDSSSASAQFTSSTLAGSVQNTLIIGPITGAVLPTHNFEGGSSTGVNICFIC